MKALMMAAVAATVSACGTPPGLRIPDVPETETTRQHRIANAGVGVSECPWYQMAPEATRQAVQRAVSAAYARLEELPDGRDAALRQAVMRQEVMLWSMGSLAERCGHQRDVFGPAIREAEATSPGRGGARR